jgi:hypothetical protein
MSLSVVEDVQYHYGSQESEKSIFDTIKSIREGLSYYEFAKVLNRLPFNITEWSSYLHISERTMLRYKNDNLLFDALQTDKIYQLTKVYDQGLEVFGEYRKFGFRWA